MFNLFENEKGSNGSKEQILMELLAALSVLKGIEGLHKDALNHEEDTYRGKKIITRKEFGEMTRSEAYERLENDCRAFRSAEINSDEKWRNAKEIEKICKLIAESHCPIL